MIAAPRMEQPELDLQGKREPETAPAMIPETGARRPGKVDEDKNEAGQD